MADAVRTEVAQSGYDLVVHMTNASDGTGETDAVKVARASYTLPGTSTTPTSFRIVRARWAVQGFSSVRIEFKRTSDVQALMCSGSGYDDFSAGGFLTTTGSLPGITDSGTGGTGDIVATTVGASATATYDITLHVQLVP